jgi:hypothetical protein
VWYASTGGASAMRFQRGEFREGMRRESYRSIHCI